jgi:hypothetical protein
MPVCAVAPCELQADEAVRGAGVTCLYPSFRVHTEVSLSFVFVEGAFYLIDFASIRYVRLSSLYFV